MERKYLQEIIARHYEVEKKEVNIDLLILDCELDMKQVEEAYFSLDIIDNKEWLVLLGNHSNVYAYIKTQDYMKCSTSHTIINNITSLCRTSKGEKYVADFAFKEAKKHERELRKHTLEVYGELVADTDILLEHLNDLMYLFCYMDMGTASYYYLEKRIVNWYKSKGWKLDE